MKILTYSQSNDLIKIILKEKLHILQLYKWNGNKKSTHELLITLEDNNVEIIQQLLNYYLSNSMKNTE